MHYFKTCLICNSNNLAVLKDYKKDHLCICNKCGFVFAIKNPTYQELMDEYAKYPRSNVISEITIKRYDTLLKLFEKYRDNNNIIDVGAGDGHFIARARMYNWNSYATEFDDSAVQLCKQKDVIVHQGKLDIKNYEKEFFDVIFSSEVIEHINNPIEEIKNFHKILRKGGLVFITTPNLNSISHKILKNKWSVFCYPEHLCYYNPKTLEKLFKDNGFKKIVIQTTGFSPSGFYQSLGYKQINNNDEELRYKTENKLVFKLFKKGINTFLNVDR